MLNHRIRKRQIIRKSKEFNGIFWEGVRLNSEHLLLLAINSNSKKFGFAVSRNISGAVRRNRAKRLLREVVRLNQDILPENKSVVLVAKPGIEKAGFKILTHELKTLVSRLDVKNNP